MNDFEIFFNILLGISLAAAVGFRIFVPLLIMSIASMLGFLTLSEDFEWIATYPALIVFLAASIFELAAYYIPFIDNVLDTIAGPIAVIAGTIVLASTIVDMDPLFKWTLAIIAGGGVAGSVQNLTTITRGASTVSTAGIANPIFSSAETVASIGISLVSILFPAMTIIFVLFILFWISRKLIKKKSAV